MDARKDRLKERRIERWKDGLKKKEEWSDGRMEGGKSVRGKIGR